MGALPSRAKQLKFDPNFNPSEKAKLVLETKRQLAEQIAASKKLIGKAHQLAVKEAEVCAPLLAAAKKWEPIALATIVLFGLASTVSALVGLRQLPWIFFILMLVLWPLALYRKQYLLSCRQRLFGTEWTTLVERWEALGLKEAWRIAGIGIDIIEVNKLYGRKRPQLADSTTFEYLNRFSMQIEAELRQNFEQRSNRGPKS